MEHRTEQSLKDYTSFKVGGKAKDFYIPFTVGAGTGIIQGGPPLSDFGERLQSLGFRRRRGRSRYFIKG